MYEIMQCTSLNGKLCIQGAKNAVLPMLAATILNKGITRLCNCPKISDVYTAIEILEYIGCKVTWIQSDIIVDTKNANKYEIPSDLLVKMRASVIFLGSLLGRFGKALITYPGGCCIGKRPIDLHLFALRQLGAKIVEKDETIYASTNGMVGATFKFSLKSVGATENAILAAVLAQGETVINNCAIEPEIIELTKLLNKLGADIKISKNHSIKIIGVRSLKGTSFKVCGDRIVAGTYMVSVAMVGGSVRFKNIKTEYLKEVIRVLRKMGCTIIRRKNSLIIIRRKRKKLKSIRIIETSPHPGFPTDMQSQIAVLLTKPKGISIIHENVFESRFKIVPELNKMGASMVVKDGNFLMINGGSILKGNTVQATDLRGGAALIIAGLSAKGKTVIHGEEYIKRGYEDIIGDLQNLGAVLKEIEG